MAASATIRPHSSTSSGASTPWLSPEVSSATWRSSYTSSADLSRRSSPASAKFDAASIMASESSSLTSRDPHSQEWWEHVLPPGQLAERLRKAQRSTSGSRRRNNPALANATPSERSAWKRLSGLPTEKRQQDRSESSSATSSRRSSFQGSSAAATLPRSALKSSHRSHDVASIHFGNASQSESSAEVSSDECGGTSTGQHTPSRHARFAFPTTMPSSTGERDQTASLRRSGVKTAANSPEMVSSSSWSADAFDSSRNVHHNSHGRRMRVMSEDGMASSLFASAHSSSSASTYRLPGSQSAVHLSQLASSSGSSNASTWSGTAADRARAKFMPHSLPDTPELSSDDGADATTFSTTTTQRVRKTSTTKTTVRSTTSSKAASPPTILRSHFDRPDQPACGIASEEVDGYASPTGRRDRHVSFDQATEIPRRASVHDYAEPMTSSQSAFSFGSLPSRDYSSPFDSLPPRSNSTRRSRQGVRASGRRTTSFSLPGSRRGSIREDSPFFQPHTASAPDTGAHRRSSSIPDVVLLESLNVAHKQLASAGNLALTLTRQLSAPLRPVLHMTLFLGISSLTVVSLACFLCASYMLTAWDDVSRRTSKVTRVAGRTKQRFERTLDWGLRMLGPEAEKPPRGGASTAGSDESDEKRTGAGHVLLWPARVAFSGATKVASSLTPRAVSDMFGGEEKRSTLPPRPPLSTLLPSILFTLLLALGAGLTSFWASRSGRSAQGSSASARAYSVPTAGYEFGNVAEAPSASPFGGRRPASSANGGWDKEARRSFASSGLGR